MSPAVTQGGRPPVALLSLPSAIAPTFSDEVLVHEMHFLDLFVSLFIYSGNFERSKLN